MLDKLGRQLQPGDVCYFDAYVDVISLVLITRVTPNKLTFIRLPHRLGKFPGSDNCVSTSTQNTKFMKTGDFVFEPSYDDIGPIGLRYGVLHDIHSYKMVDMNYKNNSYCDQDNDKVEAELRRTYPDGYINM